MVLSWLAQEGPFAAKHHSWAHPLCVVAVHYSVLILVVFGIHDWLVISSSLITWSESEPCQTLRWNIGCFLACYNLWFLPWRLCFCNPIVPRVGIVYEFTWLCNGTLILGCLASFTNRPVISTACCVTVGIDQLLWYVDLVGFAVSGKFPVGVAKYLSWPETTNALRLTCTHHLWTIPLLITTSGGVVPVESYNLSFLLMVLNVSLSRWMIPSAVHVPISKDKTKSKYLNVNLSHELWKDIKIQLLQINYDNPPVFLYLFRLLWRWQGFNTLVYFTLVLLGRVFFAGENHVCKPLEGRP